jgi:hypothetical protein
MMKRARDHKWLILISAYIVLITILAVVDEPLNPEIKSFITIHFDRVPDEENGYYAALGISAPAGANIHAKGIEIVRIYREAKAKQTGFLEFDLKKYLGDPQLSFTGQMPELYKDKGFSCLAYAKTSKEEIEKLLALNHELLDRYYSLYRYPHYRDSAPPGLFPLLAPVRNANRLVLLGLAAEANAGRTDVVLDKLRRDIAYWRLVLKESDELITKLVSSANIKMDYLFLSDLISHNKIGRGQLRAVETLVVGLSPEELNMSGAMRREFEFSIDEVRETKKLIGKPKPGDKKDRWKYFLGPFYKVNASINIIYPSHKKLVEAAALPARDLVSESKKWEETKKWKVGLEYFYNFVGVIGHKVIGDRENLRYLPYLTRMHDLDGLIRLVAIQFMAKEQRMPPQKMDEFARTLDARYSNPYTGTPMKWDAEKKCLYFESLSKEDQKPKRIELCL